MKAPGLAMGAPLIAAGMAVIWLFRWKLNAMTLSEDEATSLGINVKRVRLLVITGAAMITASVVSMCGLIGWVGLLIPRLILLEKRLTIISTYK